MQSETYLLTDPESFKLKALLWSGKFDTACYLDSNNYRQPGSAFDVLIAAGVQHQVSATTGNAFEELEKFLSLHQAYIPGFLSYDLKNETEDLPEPKSDQLQFPDLYFFVPENLILIRGEQAGIFSPEPANVWQQINEITIPAQTSPNFRGSIRRKISRSRYIETVNELKEHIQQGNIYEVNFCQEFYAENAHLDPLHTFRELNRISPTPFSCYFRHHDQYILSASPERFLSRRGDKLISQPIKGTSPRNADPEKDELSAHSLLENEKEVSENVMIVDLVRNDLTRSAAPGTVKVEELCGIYSFPQVHQMISTVVCKADSRLSNAAIIRNTFPMGSMTGAPKLRAMQLIDHSEQSRRGIYSGATGYFSPDGDFDLNVVIRTILYNAGSGYLSFHVGSAITIDAVPEKEYEECLLKAKAILTVLGCNNLA